MKENLHPSFQEVLFVDSATGTKYLIGSTLRPSEKEKFEGKDYPVVRVPISSSSHPFFRGSDDLIDAEGHIDKFQKKYKRKSEELQRAQAKQAELTVKKTKRQKRS
jgi:large subunit ribosomal protein L31